MTPDSALQLGVRHSRIATDAAALDQENTTVYGSFNYRMLPASDGERVGPVSVQHLRRWPAEASAFGAVSKDKIENFWLVGIESDLRDQSVPRG